MKSILIFNEKWITGQILANQKDRLISLCHKYVWNAVLQI